MTGSDRRQSGAQDIAVVGMAAHLPGASDIFSFWDNLKNGRSAIVRLSEPELLAAGESAARLHQPNYVPFAAPLSGFDQFDAEFFGFSPKEAAILDPQHRQFLEVAWEALENAGHPPDTFSGKVGVYAGCGMGSYFYFNLCSNRDLVDETGLFLLRHTGNDKDFLATRVSHILDLKGPSINLQTACSTSLVAVHYAAQALLAGECDMALAGGVTVELPQGRGYLFTEGEILSPDGQCHAFDHRAQGTVFGSGAGCVVLRRASDAIRDGDHIWAILKGSAVNNDGAAKAGYLAPSVEGQADCISMAQSKAGVRADTISYVECHGTGTYLGDPIEVAALTSAFRQSSDAVGHCRIGSVKTNIGHLDTAAGVASLIKVALALHHRQIPPSLGYEAPNPSIDFAGSPFVVNDRLTDWHTKAPRRAGVNSLGVGGTNAHLVLQEAAEQAQSEQSPWPFQPIVLSARSRAALDSAAERLAAHLRAHPDQNLADVAYTLKQGRRGFAKRRVLVAHSPAEAANLLEGADPRRVFSHDLLGDAPEVVFMFPGGGAQYAGMARGLYATEPVFADWMDQGLEILQPRLDVDIRALWLPALGQETAADQALLRPSLQLPLVMIIEYALAQLYKSWGVQPALLLGHSMGENTAACLAGVISFADCIGLVHLRGQLFDSLAPGGMLSVPMAEADLRPLLGGNLDLAVVNAPGLCVASGPVLALQNLAQVLAEQGIEAQRIAIDVAAHSHMLEPILARFEAYLRGIRLHAPRVPIMSNRSGQLLSDAQAVSPEYWVSHLREAVQFQACMSSLMAKPGRVFLEVGPGRALSSLAQANGVSSGQVVVALRHKDHETPDDAWHMASLARLWACGVAVDWDQIWGGVQRRRVVLPGYAFQRQRYFIEPSVSAQAGPQELPARIADVGSWGWQPHWRPTSAGVDLAADFDQVALQNWVVFLDEEGLGSAAVSRLRSAGHTVTTVRAGDAFGRDDHGDYVLAPERGREGYDRLIRDLVAQGRMPARIAHFWLVTRGQRHRPGSSFFHRNLEQGFYSVMFLAQALSDENLLQPVHLTVFTSGAAQVNGEGLAHPEKACVAGPVRVMPKEMPGITAATLDIRLPAAGRSGLWDALVDAVLEEMLATPADTTAALRGTRRYVADLRQVVVPEQDYALPTGAHVLITGGFGGIGLTLAEDMIRRFSARITLIGRHALPDPAVWPKYLAGHAPTGETARRILAVQRLQALGGNICVAAADVCNVEEMRGAKDMAEQQFGRVQMVIHAAGAVDDAPLALKSPAQVETVLAAKLHGTQVLDQLFPDGALETLVLFASSSTVTGPAGQIDYVAANSYLNAYANARAGGKTKVIALNWGIWADVGMAAQAVASNPDGQPEPVNAPLLDDMGFDSQGHRMFGATLGVNRWLLDGHRTASGQALLPGTGYLEIIAEALRAQGEPASFEIRDLYFYQPFEVADTVPTAMRARLMRSEEGYSFDLRSAVQTDGRTGWRLHAESRLLPLATVSERLDLLAIAARLPQPETGIGLVSPQEAHLRFGARWRVLRSRAFGPAEGLARLTLPTNFAAEVQNWLLHPALMDMATGWAMPLIDGYTPDHLWVPLSYKRVRVLRALPEDVVSWVRLVPGSGPGEAEFDITLAAPDGSVCVQIEGFVMHRLQAGLAFDAPDVRNVTFDRVTPHAGSPGQARLAQSLRLGIKPEEGALAFRRSLVMPQSVLYLSSIDLPALVEQAAGQQAQSGRHSFKRPELATTYLAPQDEVETRLAGFWQELLGVQQVGMDDSFFDLGGHSLIAVRMFAKIKKAYGVDLPISVLMQAPTIAKCATLIRAQIGPETSAKAATAVRRFTHLVPMHDGEGGRRRPFFLAAGMFGNVLNLRHLALLLGADRPFYGMQARGLYGDTAPHDRLDQAATDYIAEMRQVQPKGPYLLGGFSGGGLIAWEIAHQLEAVGEEVALLALLDTPLPVRPALSRSDKARIKLAELRRNGPRYLLQWLQDRRAWQKQKRQAGPAEDSETQFHNRAIEAAFRAAVAVYQLPIRQGATVLFRPPLDRFWPVGGGQFVSKAKEYVTPDNDLTRFAPKLQVVEVPGDHDSMVLEPCVRVLAARLAAAIDKVEGGSNIVALATAAE